MIKNTENLIEKDIKRALRYTSTDIEGTKSR